MELVLSELFSQKTEYVKVNLFQKKKILILIECPEFCISCTSSSKCQACVDGCYLSDSKSCVREFSCSSEGKGKETQAAVYRGLFDGASAISNAIALGSSMPTNFGLVAKILRNSKYLNVSVSQDLQETSCAWKIRTGIFPTPKDSQGDLCLGCLKDMQ